MKRECVWPKLYKRGPAKGYIEALEHRLAVTEAVLLQLLQVSDDAVLRDAFRHEPSKKADVLNMAATATATTTTTTTTDAAGRIEAKKTGTIAHWDNFPLKTADDVKRWAGEILGRRTDDVTIDEGAHEEAYPRPFKAYPVPPDPLPNGLADVGSRASADAFPPRPIEPTAAALPTAVEPVLASSEAFARDMATDEVFDLSQDFRRQFVW
ncbi:zn2-c6 fungal-type dna-binding domain [Trichoderma cornu-damae]|uniref:Zn2-c6 fungal-type dna-binding domain n=1 Tax=Trichoderma cornu-damae TaxID=654480 RepID=A0A9P8TWL1_9HYPO|nr:zn2-c6 fungal-type dna-binding domain [Trichoderma cornu-damae]